MSSVMSLRPGQCYFAANQDKLVFGVVEPGGKKRFKMIGYTVKNENNAYICFESEHNSIDQAILELEKYVGSYALRRSMIFPQEVVRQMQMTSKIMLPFVEGGTNTEHFDNFLANMDREVEPGVAVVVRNFLAKNRQRHVHWGQVQLKLIEATKAMLTGIEQDIFERAGWVSAITHINDLAAEGLRVKEVMANPAKATLDIMSPMKTPLTEKTWFVHCIAKEFLKLISEEGKQYLTYDFVFGDSEAVSVTVRQKDSKSGAEIIAELREKVVRYEKAIRKHRDLGWDEMCWEDDITLYEELPEVKDKIPEHKRMVADPREQIMNCVRFICSRIDPSKVYVSPEEEVKKRDKRIEELEAEVKALKNGKEKDNSDLWRIC